MVQVAAVPATAGPDWRPATAHPLRRRPRTEWAAAQALPQRGRGRAQCMIHSLKCADRSGVLGVCYSLPSCKSVAHPDQGLQFHALHCCTPSMQALTNVWGYVWRKKG